MLVNFLCFYINLMQNLILAGILLFHAFALNFAPTYYLWPILASARILSVLSFLKSLVVLSFCNETVQCCPAVP
jgi:hypothetical protein